MSHTGNVTGSFTGQETLNYSKNNLLLTPLIAATQFKNSLNFWYHADNLTRDEFGLVSRARDLTGNGNDGIQNSSGNRLTYFPSDPMFGGRSSFGSTSSTGNRHLAAPSHFFCLDQIFSAYYKDGIDTTFDVFSSISADNPSEERRLLGSQNEAILRATFSYSLTASIGGRAQSSTILPLPASVLVASNNTSPFLSLQIGGSSVNAGRVFVGGFRHYLVSKIPISAKEIALIEGVIAWDDGTQSRLVDSHPYRYRPPLIGD